MGDSERPPDGTGHDNLAGTPIFCQILSCHIVEEGAAISRRRARRTTGTRTINTWPLPDCVSGSINKFSGRGGRHDLDPSEMIAGVIAAPSSVTSIQVANLLKLFKIPQVGALIACLFACLFVCLFACLLACLFVCLFDWLIDWLIDWLLDWLIDWLIVWLVDWLIWCDLIVRLNNSLVGLGG